MSCARELFALVGADREAVLAHERPSVAALRLFELLPRLPIVTIASVMQWLQTTKPGYLDCLKAGTDLNP